MILLLFFTVMPAFAANEKCSALLVSVPSQIEKADAVKILRALYEAGYQPRASFFKQAITPEVRKILETAVGFPISGELKTVYLRILKLFDGDLLKALEAADLPAREFHDRKRSAWTKELTHQSLRALFAAGFLPTMNFLRHSPDPKAVEILNQTTGFPTTLLRLYWRVREFHHNDFFLGLKEAGLDRNQVYQTLTKEMVSQALRALYEAGFTPNYRLLKENQNEEVLAIFKETIGFDAALSSLYSAALELHDNNFQQALTAAGLPVEEIMEQYSGRNWTLEATHLGLRALYENGFPPYREFLIGQRDRDAEAIVNKAVGFPVNLKALYIHCLAFHGGSFAQAIADAQLPLELVKAWRVPQKIPAEKMYAALRSLFDHGYFPSQQFFYRSQDPLPIKILSNAVGFPIGLRTFYIHVLAAHRQRLFQAIINAHLPVKKVVYFWTEESIQEAFRMVSGKPQEAESNQPLTRKQIAQIYRLIYEQGYPCDSSLKENKDPELRELIQRASGLELSPRKFYQRAIEAYGNLRQVLLAAKLPIDEILLRVSRDVDYSSVMPTQVERIVEDGKVRYQTLIGTAPITPEEEMLRQESFRIVLESLPVYQQRIGKKILDVIFAMESRDADRGDVLAALAREGVSIPRAHSVLKSLSESKVLHDHLVGN